MRKSIYVGLSAVTLALTLFTVSSCDKDKTEIVVVDPGDCPDEISFAGFVEPLIQSNCSTSGCHDAATSSSGYNLEGYTNISTHADDILTAIKHENSGSPMPLGQPQLNDSLIGDFDCWIQQGKQQN